MKRTLSVVLATYNEEKNLAKCLDSIKDIADEIVIVDGSSTDKTVEIAKKYKAIVKITTNKPNFHINKQMAIDLATKDWILQLDADEHVSAELAKEIEQVLEDKGSFKRDLNLRSKYQPTVNEKPEDINGYWMPRKNWFLGRFLMKGGQYPDYTLRLYRKGKGRLPQKDVHEQAVVDGKVDYLKTALLHYPYESFSFYLKKWHRYNKFFAEQIREEQKEKNIAVKLFYAFSYVFLKPAHWLFTTFLRHKGFVDGWQGFTFSLFSALRFPASYIEYIGWYKFLSIVIILVGLIFRLYNFPNRWGLGGDDSRDAMIGLEALKLHTLPLVGPFSSAGPFVFGGMFYWLISLSYLILPFFIFAPWIMLEVLSLITLGLFMYLGKILIDRKFSLILGLLAAFSPQLIVRSLTLGPHTFVATFALLTVICFILLWKKKKLIYAFLMGIFIGCALNMHYQSINLFIFFIALLAVFPLSIKKRILAFVISLLGFIIPTFPILYWDSGQGFANTRNILDYFLIAQYRLYVPNSWSLFLFKDIPSIWSFVVGNFPIVGLVIYPLSIITFIWFAIKKKIPTIFSVLGIIFGLLILLNRFYKGERSEGYMLYIMPFIILLSGLLFYAFINSTLKKLKIVGILVILVILALNLVYIIRVVSTNSGYKQFKIAEMELARKYPGQKLSIYDYKYKFYSSSMALSLIMSYDGKLDINGKKIGFSCYGDNNCPPKSLKKVMTTPLHLVDLDNVNKEEFNPEKKLWINVNQPSAYNDLIGWLNKRQLKSTFDLNKYIKERLGFI